MSENNNIIVYPNYMDGTDDETKHLWLQWTSIAEKIDNHPERFYTIMNPEGQVKTLDCKGSIGLVVKWAREFGATQKELDDLLRISTEMQLMKVRKAVLNKQWSPKVFGSRKKGTVESAALDMRSSELIDLYSKFYSVKEIEKIIIDKWNMNISQDKIKSFYIDHKEKIDKLRVDYLLSGKELRFATDIGRLEALSHLAWEMERKFEKTGSIEVSKELRATLEQIRKEIKGEEIRLTVEGKIDIQASIQANQTIHEALQKLPINMIVIGLTAAKQNLNPGSLIGLLSSSYYSKFNGFNQLSDTKEIQLPGQYIKTYNWDDIRLKNETQIVETEAIEVYEEKLTVSDRIEAVNGRQRMKELLETYKNQTR